MARAYVLALQVCVRIEYIFRICVKRIKRENTFWRTLCVKAFPYLVIKVVHDLLEPAKYKFKYKRFVKTFRAIKSYRVTGSI